MRSYSAAWKTFCWSGLAKNGASGLEIRQPDRIDDVVGGGCGELNQADALADRRAGCWIRCRRRRPDTAARSARRADRGCLRRRREREVVRQASPFSTCWRRVSASRRDRQSLRDRAPPPNRGRSAHWCADASAVHQRHLHQHRLFAVRQLRGGVRVGRYRSARCRSRWAGWSTPVFRSG